MPRVDPGLTVDTFAAQGPEAVTGQRLPVVEDETVLGVIGASRLQRLGRRRFAATRAADVMASPPAARLWRPATLWAAVDLMNGRAATGWRGRGRALAGWSRARRSAR